MPPKRSLAFGIGLAAFAIASGFSAPACSAAASLHGAVMPPGFGRLALAFDEPTTMKIRVANGVLIVAFADPVSIDVGKLARELPDYISVARVDPDRRGMRLALARPYKANLIEAGDKAFIDLLPESWKGLLPGPPPEVIADLAERLRLAQLRARDSARQPAPRPALTLRSSRLPTLERLIFQAPPDVRMTHELAEGVLRLTFSQPLMVEPAAIRPRLPDGVKLATQETTGEATQLDLTVPPDWQARSFKDDDGFVVDLLRPLKTPPVTLGGLQTEPAAPAAAAPAPGVGQPAAALAPIVAARAEPASPPPAAVAARPDPAPQAVRIDATEGADNGRVDFRFPRLTGAAAFTDADLITLVFDTRDTIDPATLKGILPRWIDEAVVTREGKVTLVRLRLSRQQIARLSDHGATWSLTLGEQAGKPADTLTPRRTVDERGQTIIAVAMPQMTGIHWIESGPGGQPLAVATALGPTRAVSKPYRFVELGLLQTAQGLAVSPRADDVVVRAGADQALIGRAGGLTVTLDATSPGAGEEIRTAVATPPLLDAGAWTLQQVGSVRERDRELLRDVADSSRGRKSEARLALARFYVANGLNAEAVGPLKVMLAEDPAMRANREALFLFGAIATRMHRNAEALAALSVPLLKEDAEAGLWRALAEARLGRPGPALAGFRRAEAILDGYPPDLQAQFRPAMVRAAMAMQDVTVAERQLGRLGDSAGGLADREELALLRAMLDDANGRPEAALNGYKPLFEARSRPVAAEAQLRAVKLLQAEKRLDISIDEQIARLETVSIIWRGGEIEIEALAELGRLYAGQQRWRDAFQTARRANENYPDSPLTRRLHDETAQRFAELFGNGDSEQLPRIDALALFYDFKEFLPIGRRGDEITRLFADRLVELDLLDQASEILRYQMDKRLTGAARSTVATRLAMIRLMNGKPAEALQALASTRLIELPGDVRRARLLLEAKALSDLSRTDQALDLLEVETGPEIDRLRADIYWTGRRWREAGEAHERLLGESWRGDGSLGEGERGDVMRAAIAYVMSDEALSLDRLRAKFAAKMSESTDARTFAFVTGASRASPASIREVARAAAGSDTLGEFMKAYRERYPAYSTTVRNRPQPPAPDGDPKGAAALPPAVPGRG